MKFLFAYLLIINYIAFSMFAFDKEMAQKKKKRILEKNLLSLCIMGGTFGAWIAMSKLKHKISKPYFKWKFYAILLVQIVFIIVVFRR